MAEQLRLQQGVRNGSTVHLDQRHVALCAPVVNGPRHHLLPGPGFASDEHGALRLGNGYVPFDKAGADLLFGFISQRYERRSLVVTTNLPFARWSEVFLDATAAAAVIDRIVHHATVLTTAGDSYRLKTATRNQASARHRR